MPNEAKRPLNEETVQASDNINTNTLDKNQNGLRGLNQEPEKTQAEERVESEAVWDSLSVKWWWPFVLFWACWVSSLIGRHVLDAPFYFEFDQLTRTNKWAGNQEPLD